MSMKIPLNNFCTGPVLDMGLNTYDLRIMLLNICSAVVFSANLLLFYLILQIMFSIIHIEFAMK